MLWKPSDAQKLFRFFEWMKFLHSPYFGLDSYQPSVWLRMSCKIPFLFKKFLRKRKEKR
jgi:hypothetical protein